MNCLKIEGVKIPICDHCKEDFANLVKFINDCFNVIITFFK